MKRSAMTRRASARFASATLMKSWYTAIVSLRGDVVRAKRTRWKIVAMCSQCGLSSSLGHRRWTTPRDMDSRFVRGSVFLGPSVSEERTSRIPWRRVSAYGKHFSMLDDNAWPFLNQYIESYIRAARADGTRSAAVLILCPCIRMAHTVLFQYTIPVGSIAQHICQCACSHPRYYQDQCGNLLYRVWTKNRASKCRQYGVLY